MAKRVVIADDALFMRVNLKMLLGKWGYEVVGEAKDGSQAIDWCKIRKPDVLLLDITMPGMDGLTALQKIRSENKNLAIIIVSAMSQQENVLAAASLGINDFVVKPIDEYKLKEALDCLE